MYCSSQIAFLRIDKSQRSLKASFASTFYKKLPVFTVSTQHADIFLRSKSQNI